MIVTTTPEVQGLQIDQYIRVVAGETVAGINALKDIGAGFRNIVGGRSGSYESEILQARETALGEMVERAMQLGAQGIVGVDIDYLTLGQGNMVMVSASGTAVTFKPAEAE
ncbi:YbjQ family protein [Corynebacterium heidelbergense]|uniref:UPF0145 protein CWC39_05210 n=1 Tax=Corynebacterium heidelbergense TaxID=2055947 RepID=A0A364VBL1_9CORY|nr:YbjQ family protein [Corynebacterium heidelbergense]RAV34043.1 hypothetical protein CWC39_05210 [Corynebacterium heidelbergense]WCZ35627.1 hypothetical protein CHEID_00225 [Corynebacterium heidelbergense]